MKNYLFPLLFLLMLSACRDKSLSLSGSTSEEALYSQLIGDEFLLNIYLPEAYSPEKSYPTLFLLDGSWYFDELTEEVEKLVADGEISAAILVGLGYTEEVEEKRFRDYTYPEDTDYDILNGEAVRFYQFLQSELLPHISSRYSIDTTQLSLMGHSLGGFFSLFTFLSHPESSPFNGYVAISSSIWWKEGYLFKLEESLSNRFQAGNFSSLPVKLYLALGQDEPPSMTILNEEMAERLSLGNYPQFQLKKELFKGASHSQVPIKGFKEGLSFILRN